MAERPLILFPAPEVADRANLPSGRSKLNFPEKSRQFERIMPQFSVLSQALEQKTLSVQQSSTGINPELALVFEVIGSTESFFASVKKVQGLEWMFDSEIDNYEPDDDFYILDQHGQRKEENLNGRVYCIMVNKEALQQLLSLWNRYRENDDFVFERGYTGFRDVFLHLKNIRPWGVEDRIFETNVMEYWREGLEIDGDQPIPFEIELFFRKELTKRETSSITVHNAVTSFGGRVLRECVIVDIAYHCFLVELPRNKIEFLVQGYTDVAFAKVDDIMFFRPIAQSFFPGSLEVSEITEEFIINDGSISTNEPIIAVFDGMPLQNHRLLNGKLIIDDPDNYEEGYLANKRYHGTAMASLALYGDLNRIEYIHGRKIYFRPILKPYDNFNGLSVEKVPDNVIIVDLIHRAVRRIFEGDGSISAVAPTVKIINLSLGDPARQFVNTMSPLARLLDWLSNRYRVLFVISAGNQNASGIDINIPFDNFKLLPMQERSRHIFDYIKQNTRSMRILSPAESINSLCVGALFTDFSTSTENPRQIFPIEDMLPSLISSIGLGYNRAIKPDIFYNGGRKFITGTVVNSNLMWSNSSREPGCRVAAPHLGTNFSGETFTFGTSDAAAQITHEAGKCYEILNEIFINETGSSVPNEFAAIILKAMIAHGASWDSQSEKLASLLGESPKRLSRWLGNGVPNVSRVEECAKNRITLIGFGTIKREKAHLYSLPLPFNFSSQLIKRRLTVTLAYFSPIVSIRQTYRSAQMWFNIATDTERLLPDRQNTDWRSVQRGTLQHEIFTGENAVTWDVNDSLKIKINCRDCAERLGQDIPYSILVTFEVAEGTNLDVYTGVSSRIRPVVPIINMP